MKLRRLQQASFLPCTVENDKRQLQAQSQSRSTSKSGISSGAFLVVLQLTMDIMLSPLTTSRQVDTLVVFQISNTTIQANTTEAVRES